MPSPLESLYERVCQYVRETAILASISEMLGWDERTMMPAAGSPYRAEQITLLSSLVHQRWTDPQLGAWLSELAGSELAADPHSDTGATIRRLNRSYQRRVRLPKSLVEELARTAVLGQSVWQQARADNDFSRFLPILEKTIGLKQQEAEALGYPETPYDALLDDYEPEARTSQVAEALAGLRDDLIPLVAAVRESGVHPDRSILTRVFPVAAQEAFSRAAASRIGFDFARGRLDVTAHPFCARVAPHDCRITTHYVERSFSALFAVLHESGHGIYEQGLPTAQFGLPLGEPVSMGIHESQSRLWENTVGRSQAFWQFFFDDARQRFAPSLDDVSLDAFLLAVNDVRPSLIRIEADEATYNLHILVRFELEQALLAGDLPPADLPAAWRAKYRDYLGVEPGNDGNGCLQDIHWSAGLFAYFPTYALGNLYAAQFYAQADRELGPLDETFARGDFQPLREWLTQKIYSQGQRFSAAELIERVTGSPLSHQPFIAYLRRKLGRLYGID